jgi:hypothetical protein
MVDDGAEVSAPPQATDESARPNNPMTMRDFMT